MPNQSWNRYRRNWAQFYLLVGPDSIVDDVGNETLDCNDPQWIGLFVLCWKILYICLCIGYMSIYLIASSTALVEVLALKFGIPDISLLVSSTGLLGQSVTPVESRGLILFSVILTTPRKPFDLFVPLVEFEALNMALLFIKNIVEVYSKFLQFFVDIRTSTYQIDFNMHSSIISFRFW